MFKTKPKQSKEKVQASANIPGEAPTSSSAPSLPGNNVSSEKTKSDSSLQKRTPIAQSKKKHSKGKAQATAHIPEEAPTSSSAPSSSSLSANNVPSEKTKAGRRWFFREEGSWAYCWATSKAFYDCKGTWERQEVCERVEEEIGVYSFNLFELI